MSYTKDNSCFLCHRCLETFHQKSSILRHLDRKNKCIEAYRCPYNDKEVNIRSLHRFYFDGVTTFPDLTIADKTRLVLNYNDGINIILPEFFTDYGKDSELSLCKLAREPSDPTSISDVPSKDQRSNVSGAIQPLDTKRVDQRSEMLEELQKVSESDFNADWLPSDMSLQPSGDLRSSRTFSHYPKKVVDTINESSESMNTYRIVVEGIEKFKCIRCITIFNNEKSLLKHMENKKTCESRCKKRSLYQTYSTSLADQGSAGGSRKSSSSDESKYTGSISTGSHTTLINGTFIQNQQNIHNQQNINNNVVQNNQVNPRIQLELKNFLQSDFDYIHINNNEVFNDDFFRHKTFLSHILQNDVNKIIYFDRSFAYIHTNKQIIRVPKDKAGYILMNKLSSTMGSYLRSNSLIKQEDYDDIIKFYNVEERKYLNDTLYKEYDFKLHQHVPSTSQYMRTREHYLGEAIGAIVQVQDRIKELFNQIVPIEERDESVVDLNIINFTPRSERLKGFGDE